MSNQQLLQSEPHVKRKGRRQSVIAKRPDEAFRYHGQSFTPHTHLPLHESALYRMGLHQREWLIVLAMSLLFFLLLDWRTTIVVMVALLTTCYFLDLFFYLYLIIRSFLGEPEIRIAPEALAAQTERTWPLYTIFCPLYKEWEVLPQFITAIEAMDYPKDRLQVVLLLEEDDTETVSHAREMALPSYVEIEVVPHAFPKTKPKACNYGLWRARGEYVVIYDAEDVPDVQQLKKAVLAFEQSTPDIICIQAKLNFYNPHQNLLTRAFTGEYSLWFDLILTGLQSVDGLIPLGGTSNHFKTAVLREIDGWDAFNVTEDCDLGVRLAKRGYRTAIMDSVTLEEANSSLPNWVNQRSRWIKGYMQTYLVHMRQPRAFIQASGSRDFAIFQLIVGGKILLVLVNPLMWGITISYFAFRTTLGPTIESFYPAPVLAMGLISLVFGNFLYFYYYMIACTRRGQDELVKYAYLVPFYWLAMSFASWKALWQLIVKPHYWAKTKHGLHLDSQRGLNQATEVLGRSLVNERLTVATMATGESVS